MPSLPESPSLLRLSAALMLAVGPASSAERLWVNDARAFGGVIVSDFHASGNVGASGTPDAAEGLDYRAGVMFMRGKLNRHGGVLYGAAFTSSNARYRNAGVETTVENPMIEILAGAGIALLPYFHIEITPLVGIGYSYSTVHPVGGPVTSNRSSIYEYGATAGIYWTFDRCWQIGLSVPYVRTHSHPIYSYIGSGGTQVRVDQRRDTEGAGILVMLGVRF